MPRDITKFDDLIDIRDVIERFEEIEESSDEDDQIEKASLENLLNACAGNGGDEKWRGEWYPVALIRDSFFIEYAQELAEDIGVIDDNARWLYTCIDWDRAAHELQMDYTPIEFEGVTYWGR